MTIKAARKVAVLVGALALSASARADETGARCVVRVIHGIDDTDPANTDVKIDPKIDRLRPYLSKPPFTSWAEFILLDKKTVDLAPKVPQSFELPNGKTASLTFLEHLPDQAGKHRVRLQLQIGDPAKPALSTVFVVDEGGVVVQAGMHYKKGLLILGTSCDQAHAR